MKRNLHSLWLVLLVASAALAQPGAVVEATMRIEIDKRMHTARKINGRWWSEDNRELTRTNVGWLWQVSGGNAQHLVRFDHHDPVDPARVDRLDRSMGPSQVRNILGPPNSVFPSDEPEERQIWSYYGRDGYKLSIHFSHSGGIFNASYEPNARSMPKDVPHLAFRFNGKTARESYEERKQQPPARTYPGSQAEFRAQLRAEMAQRRSGGSAATTRATPSVVEVPGGASGGSATPAVVDVPAAAAKPAAARRKVTAEELKSVAIGMTRAEVIALLGEPFSGIAITSAEGTREILEYQTEAGTIVRIVVFQGKVAQLPR